jgi:hypothetical protein
MNVRVKLTHVVLLKDRLVVKAEKYFTQVPNDQSLASPLRNDRSLFTFRFEMDQNEIVFTNSGDFSHVSNSPKMMKEMAYLLEEAMLEMEMIHNYFVKLHDEFKEKLLDVPGVTPDEVPTLKDEKDDGDNPYEM